MEVEICRSLAVLHKQSSGGDGGDDLVYFAVFGGSALPDDCGQAVVCSRSGACALANKQVARRRLFQVPSGVHNGILVPIHISSGNPLG